MKLYWSIAKRLARLRSTPSVFKRLNAHWLLDPKDWLDLQLIIGRPFETAQRSLFTDLCRRYKVTHFLDCGANFGLYSVLLARDLSFEEMHAFEPVRTTRARLMTNLWLNGLVSKINVHGVGLSDARGEVEINIDPSSTGVSAITPSEDEIAHRDFSDREIIRTDRLDDVVSIKGQRIALKIDVEGHELALLDGAGQLLTDNWCIVQIEARPRNQADIIARFQAMGYDHVNTISEDLYFVSASES